MAEARIDRFEARFARVEQAIIQIKKHGSGDPAASRHQRRTW
jgi:hypothetical protein